MTPFLLHAERTSWVRGEEATFNIKWVVQEGNPESIDVDIIGSRGEKFTIGKNILFQKNDNIFVVRFSTGCFKSGRYILKVKNSNQEDGKGFIIGSLSIVSPVCNYPIYVWWDIQDIHQIDSSYIDLIEHGINTVFVHFEEMNQVAFDLATRYGLRLFSRNSFGPGPMGPTLKILDINNRPDAVAINIDGERLNQISLFHPDYEKWAENSMERLLEKYGRYPSFCGIMYDDEPSFSPYGKLIDYSPIDTEAFRKLHGVLPPRDMSDKKLWQAWMDFRTQNMVTFYNKLSKIIDSKRPGIKTTTVLAWAGTSFGADNNLSSFFASLDIAFTDIYHGPDPSLILPFTLSLYQSSIHDKPVWVLLQAHNLWTHDYTKCFGVASPSDVREQVFLSLASGVDGIGYFVYDVASNEWTLRGTPTWEEIKRLNKILHEYGPFLSQLKRVTGNIAILRSLATENMLWDVKENPFNPWDQWHRIEEVYYGLVNAHVSTDVIVEDNILNGELPNYKILLLIRVTYLEEKVIKIIKQFIKNGGEVFADMNTTVNISEIKRINATFDDWLNLVKGGEKIRKADNLYPITKDLSTSRLSEVIKETRSFVETNNPKTLLFTLQGKQIRCQFIINDNQANEEIAEVTFNNRKDYYIYDILDNTKTKGPLFVKKNTNKTFKTKINPGDAKIMVFCSEEPTEPNIVINKKEFLLGDTLEYEIIVSPADYYPVKVEVIDSAGENTEYGIIGTTVNGILKGEIRLAKNDMLGMWQIKVTNLLNMKQKGVEFDVLH